jgi:glycosyltransferase involved in cell wall biosynthesis
MRIVLDGAPLTEETGGIRRYVEELATSLTREFPEDEVYVVNDRPMRDAELLVRAGAQIRDSTPKGWANQRWWLMGISNLCDSLNATVFHGTDFSVPYLHKHPAVLTVHDLSPWLRPEWQPSAKRIRQRTPWMIRLGLADAVITVSESMRTEIIARFGIPRERVHAIPLAANSRFRPAHGYPEQGVEGAPPYFLYVGTLEPRKNVPEMIAAWLPVYQETGVALKIAGRRRQDFSFHAEHPGLAWLGAVPDEELPSLYSGALAVVYPSEYEGFGLPVLEAMQCGAPVVVGPAAALRELVADGGIVVMPTSTPEFGGVLRRFATEKDFRMKWSERGLCRAQLYSWNVTAQRTRGVYQEAIARFERTA